MNENGDNLYQLNADGWFEQNHKWSPNGSKLGFASDRDGNFEIYTVNIDGTDLRRLTYHPGFQSYNFCWSPDGSQIAYTSDETGNSEIYVMDSNGGNKKRLTYNSWTDGEPLWSPDGLVIIFISFINSDVRGCEIFRINVDGSDVRQLTNQTVRYSNQISFCPDGLKMAYVSDKDGRHELYTMRVDGTENKKLLEDFDIFGCPQWSPNGEKILFVSLADVSFELFTVRHNGNDCRRLTYNTYSEFDPVWAPDGKRIFFVSERENSNSQIFSMNTDSSNEKQLTFSEGWHVEPRCSPILYYGNF